MDDYLFWFRTPQTATIKTLFDAIKHVLLDGELVVTKKGIQLEGTNTQQTIIVDMLLDADKIKESGEFFCSENVRIGIDMNHLNLFLKNAETKHIVTFCIERNTPTDNHKEDFLSLRFEDSESRSLEHHYVALMNPERQRIPKYNHGYSCVQTVSCEALRRYIKTMQGVGEVCKITNINGNELRLSTKGLVGEYNVRLLNNDEDDEAEGGEDDARPPNLVICDFKVKALEFLVRPSNLCAKVNIGIDNRVPLTAQFQIASIGEIKYIIGCHVDPDA